MAHAGGGPGPGQEPLEPLIGAAGNDYVMDLLSREHPQTAIQKIQKRASLHHPLCAPLLGLVDQLGVTYAGGRENQGRL